MRYLAIPIICCLFFATVSCSGGGPKVPGSQSGQDALNQLSVTHRSNFENWKASISKSCNAIEAFSSSSVDSGSSNGLDVIALLNKNNNSFVFSDEDQFAILSNYNTYLGMETSTFEESTEINGHTYKIRAEARRDGSTCTLSLFGKKIYETYVVANFGIGYESSVDKKIFSKVSAPVVRNLGKNGQAEIDGDGIFNLIRETLRPRELAVKFIGEKLGLDLSSAKQLFFVADYPKNEFIAKISEDENAVWSSLWSGNIISQRSVLEKYFESYNSSIPLEVLVPIPAFEFMQVSNKSDVGNFKLHLIARMSAKEQVHTYELERFENKGIELFNKHEAEKCAVDRLFAYLSDDSNYRGEIRPSVELMMQPCQVIFSNIREEAYASGFYKDNIAHVFAGIIPSARFSYGEWDDVLATLAKQSMAAEVDPKEDLDPSGVTQIIPSISAQLYSIEDEVKKTKNMKQFKEQLYNMGMGWVFTGTLVDETRLENIIQSLDPAGDIFTNSVRGVISSFDQYSGRSEALLAFASGIDEEYKEEAQKALRLSQQLEYVGFETEVFNQIIQKQISIEELKKWNVNFSTINNEISKYKNLNKVKGQLVAATVNGLRSGEVRPSDLKGYYASLNNVVATFSESSLRLIGDLERSFLESKPALDFANTVTEKYKQLAQAILKNSKAAEFEDWGKDFFDTILQKRPTLDQLKKWNGLWISTLAFVKRDSARVDMVTEMRSKWAREEIVQIAINEEWGEQDYRSLEAISALAVNKFMCDNLKDASGRASCAGLDSFSNKPKKFFDPEFKNRYTALAKKFNGYMKILTGFELSSLRSELIDSFFGYPIWSECDNAAFAKKEVLLDKQVKAIAKIEDVFRRWDLERQIGETLSNCSN